MLTCAAPYGRVGVELHAALEVNLYPQEKPDTVEQAGQKAPHELIEAQRTSGRLAKGNSGI